MTLKPLLLKFLLLCITTGTFSIVKAQSDIKVGAHKANHIDRQKRKQGEWLFFDNEGNIRMTCVFENDKCVSPIIFYENTDTIFIKYPMNDSIEVFSVHTNGKRYLGNFVHTSDSTSNIEVDPEPVPSDDVIAIIKKYQNVLIEPNYFFTQQKLKDYASAAFSGSRFIFNKPLHVVLTISGSGLVTNVELPKDKNSLSADEETELFRIYSKMPRWQPLFYRNTTRPMKMIITNNASLTIMSF